MTTQEMMIRLFQTPKLLAQQLKKREGMTEARVHSALAGEDPETDAILKSYLKSELKRDDYGIYVRTLRSGAGWSQGELATALKRTRVGLCVNESGRGGTSLEMTLDAVYLMAPEDRHRQLRDLVMGKNFEVYLDVLHAIF